MQGKPFISIIHHNAYFGLSIANRILVMILMVYIITYGKIGDLLILPLASLATGFLIIMIRIVKSNCFQTCLEKIRSWFTSL